MNPWCRRRKQCVRSRPATRFALLYVHARSRMCFGACLLTPPWLKYYALAMLAGTIMRHASASAMVDACGRAVGGIQTFHWSAPSINKVYKHSYIQYVGNDCVADSGMTREGESDLPMSTLIFWVRFATHTATQVPLLTFRVSVMWNVASCVQEMRVIDDSDKCESCNPWPV